MKADEKEEDGVIGKQLAQRKRVAIMQFDISKQRFPEVFKRDDKDYYLDSVRKKSKSHTKKLFVSKSFLISLTI